MKSKSDLLLQLCWNTWISTKFVIMEKDFFVHESAIVDAGCMIGSGTRIWHFSHIMPDAMIGKDCTIGQNVFVASGVKLGNNVKVQNNVSVYEGVECEDNVFLGPSMVFTNIRNPRSAVVRKGKYVKTIVRKGATLGANCTIVCGVEIGAYAFVAAGAVVTKPVLPYALVKGVPAVQAGWISEYGHPLAFDHQNRAICKESGEIYILDNKKVVKQTGKQEDQ